MKAALLAVLAWLAIVVAVSASWVYFIKSTTTPSQLGLAGGAVVLFVPVLLILCGVAWLVLRAIINRWRGALPARYLAAAAATMSLAGVVGLCGPTECFDPGPTGHGAGWFVIGGTTLGVFLFEVVKGRAGQPA